MKKYQHYIDARGRSFTNSTQKQWQLLQILNNLEKTDPSEIERSCHDIRKQQTYWRTLIVVVSHFYALQNGFYSQKGYS